MKQNKRNEAEVEEFDLTLSGDNIRLNPRKRKKNRAASSPVLSYVGLAGDFGFSIVVPLGGSVLIGRLIDQKFGSSPRGTIICLILGFLLSIVIFIRTVKDALRSNTKKK